MWSGDEAGLLGTYGNTLQKFFSNQEGEVEAGPWRPQEPPMTAKLALPSLLGGTAIAL